MKNKYWTLIYFVAICIPVSVGVAITLIDPSIIGLVPYDGIGGTPLTDALGYETPRTILFPVVIVEFAVIAVSTALIGGKVFVSEDEKP